ncbi:MAG: response regulator transcription factor [Chloroflexi bacterium]|nr:MAG: response regulator transcription factor [Chloroflexota bacterium]
MPSDQMSGSRGVILIVEDDATTAELIADLVEQEGFTVSRAGGGLQAIEIFTRERPVAVFLDWVLPDIPGIEACRSLRALDGVVPIIFVSGRDDEASTIRGLDAGADDYVAKPVRIRELIARLEAHIRKVGVLTERQAAEPAGEEERMRRFGDVEVDLAARLVSVEGQPLNLAPLEFSLLEYLARNAGVAVRELDRTCGPAGAAPPDQARRGAEAGRGAGRGARLRVPPGAGLAATRLITFRFSNGLHHHPALRER